MTQLAGNKLKRYWKTGTISNIDSINLVADVTIDSVLYTSISIHYHCDSDATEHGSSFFDGDDVIVLMNAETLLPSPLEIVGFVDTPKICGNLLIELDDGTKEIYDINTNIFDTYVGTVGSGNKCSFVLGTCASPTSGGSCCDSTPFRTITRDETIVGSDVPCTTSPSLYVRDRDIYYSEEYEGVNGQKIVDTVFFNYHQDWNADPDECVEQGETSEVNFDGIDIWHLEEISIVGEQFIKQSGLESPSKIPNVVNISGINKLLVLSYGTSRRYAYDGSDWRYYWTDKIVFCDEGVCQEFENISDVTITASQRYAYLISDFSIYIHSYSSTQDVFASVFKAGGNYYCFIGETVGLNFSVSRDTIFENHYSGQNIAKVSFL